MHARGQGAPEVVVDDARKGLSTPVVGRVGIQLLDEEVRRREESQGNVREGMYRTGNWRRVRKGSLRE